MVGTGNYNLDEMSKPWSFGLICGDRGCNPSAGRIHSGENKPSTRVEMSTSYDVLRNPVFTYVVVGCRMTCDMMSEFN